MLEIHGKRQCPYAWRVRLVAHEKNIPYEWLPLDVADPDPRVQQHNPEQKSPLVWQDGFQLTESLVIAQYLDEAHFEKTLQALSARERARMRLRLHELEALQQHDTALLGYEVLEAGLAEGRQFLGGSGPDLSDVCAWPFLWNLAAKLPVPERLPRARAYVSRIRERESVLATQPR